MENSIFPEIHTYFDEHGLKNEGLGDVLKLLKYIIKTERDSMKKKQAKKNDEKKEEKDVFERVIQGVVSLGYSRPIVEPIFLEEWKKGLEIENMDKAIRYIQSVIDERTRPKIQDEEKKEQECKEKEKKETCIDKEAHKKSVIEKLYKVVSIPSAVDVLNGLRKWITIVNPCDRELLFDNDILFKLLQNITNSTITPSLQFSMKYFFLEVFQFTEKTAEVIMQCLCKLSLYISIFNLDLLFLELARCFNECRVSDKEKTRRKYLKENSFKINQAQSYTIPSYSQLASLFDLITAIPQEATLPPLCHSPVYEIKPRVSLTSSLDMVKQEINIIVNEIVNELNKEMRDYHSNYIIQQSAPYQQRLFYSLSIQFALNAIHVIGDCRLKISQYNNEIQKLEKGLPILQVLKMEHNYDDDLKNIRLRKKVIGKWTDEVNTLLTELTELEGKVSSLLTKDDLLVTKDIVAHFYSICSVLKIDYTLSPSLYTELKNSIRSFRESDLNSLKKKPKLSSQQQQHAKKTWKVLPSPNCPCTITEILKEKQSP